MSATSLSPPTSGPQIGLDRLFRLEQTQFVRAVESGILPGDGGVTLVEGLLREGGAAGPLYRLDLGQYHRLVVDGILDRRDRAELLGGRLVAKMSITPPHQTSMRKARWQLGRFVPPGWFVDQNAPITMPSSGSEPEPDLSVIRGGLGDYDDRHPGPGDVALLVEVALSSLAEDRGYQKRLNAFESIPVYWIINLVDHRIEVYSDPTGPSEAPEYRLHHAYHPGELVPFVVAGHALGFIAAIDLLP